MILKGVDRYRVVEAMFEGVRVILSYRGEPYSPAYIQGISGAAFRIGGICPCAPTCTAAMSTQDLIRLLGYELAEASLCGEGIDPERDVHGMIAHVKDEIRQGRPALVWHAFTNAEWDVVCGFDQEKKLFLGRGSYAGLDAYASAPETRAKDAVQICPAFGALLIGRKIGSFDARNAELAALREAVAHAHSTKNADKLAGQQWVFLEGLMCYDRWISDFAKPEKTRGAGDSYCYGVYRSTHRSAAGFLSEIASKHAPAQQQLLDAARSFTAEADTLDQGEKLLWWSAPEGPDAERNRQAHELLKQARDHYARGIEQIKAALGLLL